MYKRYFFKAPQPIIGAMVVINHYTEKLQQEQEQEAFSEAFTKKFFDIRDFEALTEMCVSLPALLRELQPDHEPTAFAEKMLEGLLFEKIQFATSVIHDIHQELHIRKNILFEAHAKIEKETKELSEYLKQLQFYGLERGASLLRANTRTQLTQLHKEQRQIVVVAWQDTVRLRSDLREHIEKYQSLLRTKTLFEI